MKTEPSTPRKPYQTPHLEQHLEWIRATGVSLPIGLRLIPESFEIPEIQLVEQ
jgi:ParB-like chromosome segregation protein Spo0J